MKAIKDAAYLIAAGALMMSGMRVVDHLWSPAERQIFVCIQERADDYSCTERMPLPDTTESPRSWPRGLEQPAEWPVSVEPLTLEPRGDGPRMGQPAIHIDGRPGRRAGAAFGEAA